VEFRGIDFSSSPTVKKPVTLAICEFDGPVLVVKRSHRLADFSGFEAALLSKGPWVTGLDFPFCFARDFNTQMGWPSDWAGMARLLSGLPRMEYIDRMSAFRARQPEGQKHLRRLMDARTGGVSPNNVVNPPVGKMLFEGVPRLWQSGVDIPGLYQGDESRRAVEAYPAIAAKHLIGTTAYKDGKPEDIERRLVLRREIISALARPNRFGFCVDAPMSLADDPAGDDLDAAICAVQAAWAAVNGMTGPHGPDAVRKGSFDHVEGWIADPAAFDPPLFVQETLALSGADLR
jgi:hypothetical protein